jgi:N-acylneuraminate cytidylyltransferase
VFADVEVHRRSAATATDDASTESVMLEFLATQPMTDVLVLLQATSPLTRPEDIDAAVRILDRYDAVVSVVEQRRFRWEWRGESGAPIGYDPARRPRRQDHAGMLIENGAIYASRIDAILSSRCRVSGEIGLLEMPPETYAELDDAHDVPLVDALLRWRSTPSRAAAPPRAAAGVQLVINDVDGCLSDNGMYYGADGAELKRFSARDGKGFELLRCAGVRTMLLTSERGEIVHARGRKVGADFVIAGSSDKRTHADKVRGELGLDWSEVAFLGDDVHDLELLEAVGLSACPSDAIGAVRRAVSVVCPSRGGGGAFRDLADLVLDARR